MRFHRIAACSSTILAGLFLTVAVPRAAFATDAPDATPTATTKKAPHRARTHTAGKESAAARQERERREDLERRVERLEQRYELKEPAMPPADPPAQQR